MGLIKLHPLYGTAKYMLQTIFPSKTMRIDPDPKFYPPAARLPYIRSDSHELSK
jgi:hypothetical protein